MTEQKLLEEHNLNERQCELMYALDDFIEDHNLTIMEMMECGVFLVGNSLANLPDEAIQVAITNIQLFCKRGKELRT